MTDLPQLPALLEHIRLAGIPVGSAELQRLEIIFKTTPALSHVQLSELLQTVLAKNTAQRRSIERIFQTLVPFDSQDSQPQQTQASKSPKTAATGQSSSATDEQQTAKKQRIRLNFWYLGLTALATILLPLFLSSLQQSQQVKQEARQTIQQTEPQVPILAPTQITESKPHDLQLANYVTIWTPIVTVKAIDPLPKMLPPLALLLGAGLGYFWLLHHALLRSRVAQPQAPKIRQHGRSFLPALRHRPKYHLLNPNQRREMAWGIARYVGEHPQNKLDIERSVRETAREALPSIHFKNATRDREVWIWQDRASNNRDLSLLAEEITQTLQAVNITVQVSYFHGLPNQVRSVNGETIWSTQHQQPEHQPLVMVLCDHDTLLQSALLQADSQHQTFRLLSQWAHLCLVDCSLQAGQLQRQLTVYNLLCLHASQVSAWLAQQGRTVKSAHNLFPLEALQRWAIACALPDRALMEAEIRALHDALQLECRWHYHSLQRYARATGNGFDFAQQRAELLQNFAWQAQQRHPDCDKTIRFWLNRYQDIDHELGQRQTRQRPWQHSERQCLLQLEMALLQLWNKPELAASQLADLHAHPQLRSKVRAKLQHYACLDWPAAKHNNSDDSASWLRLPIDWQDLASTTRQQLLSAGFAGVTSKVSSAWNNSTAIILGTLAGLMLGGLLYSFVVYFNTPPAAQRISTALTTTRPSQQQLIKHIQQNTLILGTVNAPQGLLKTQIPEQHQLEINWQATPAYPARQTIAENTELWLAGENSRPLRPTLDDWPTLSIAVIAASPQNKTIQRLAAVLLDQGSADQVIVGTHWHEQQAKLAQQWAELPNMQWLYVLPDKDSVPLDGEHIARFTLPVGILLTQLGKPGPHQANNLQNAATVNGNPRLMGYPALQQILELPNKMKLLRIPSGSFQMGSDQNNREKPVHTVSIDYEFYLSQTEITFEQFDAYLDALKLQSSATQAKPPDYEGWGRADRPVINVSWHDAQAYSQWLTANNDYDLQCRLPSEAEWEYAARAGIETEYPWGKEIGTNNANCDGCGSQWDNKQTAPVAQFPANALGLHDMHGNVYEWVQDCWHDDYTKAPADGSVWKDQCSDSGRRVVRGGSWNDIPVSLRSADRFYFHPDLRSFNLGFRVLCSPPFAH